MLGVFRTAMFSFAVLIVSVFFAPQAAQAQPAGSYQQSCFVHAVSNASQTMTAECMKRRPNPFTSPGWVMNNDFNWKYCLGDISNNDGTLTCAFNQAKYDAEQQAAADSAAFRAQVQAALPPFRSASALVLGRTMGDGEIANRMRTFKQADPQAVADGVTLVEAIAFLKSQLAAQANAPLRTAATTYAFREVHGVTPTPTEQATYDSQIRAQQRWYATIVFDETKRLNQTPALRTAMIERAYQAAFGRAASAAEQAYWMPRTETYRQLLGASRNWLYSQPGATDLVQTVTRALQKAGKPHGQQEVSAAMTAYGVKRALFFEMK